MNAQPAATAAGTIDVGGDLTVNRLGFGAMRITGRGSDYRDASFAPTHWGLNRLLSDPPVWDYQYVVPANVAWATAGHRWHYRLGVCLLQRWPTLWAVAKVFLVVARKPLSVPQ